MKIPTGLLLLAIQNCLTSGLQNNEVLEPMDTQARYQVCLKLQLQFDEFPRNAHVWSNLSGGKKSDDQDTAYAKQLILIHLV